MTVISPKFSGVSGGASIASWWNPLLPQDPLQAETDYFESDDAKWTLWNPGGNTTVTVVDGELKIVQTSAAGASWGGRFQTAPTDDEFVVTSLVSLQALLADYSKGGIFVAGDLTGGPAAAKFATSEIAYNVANGIRFASEGFDDYNGPTNFSEASQLGEGVCLARVYIKRSGGGTFRAGYSLTGRHWVWFAAKTWAAAGLTTVDKIGIGVSNNGSGEDVTLYSPMFRVDRTSNRNLPCGGLVGAPAA